MNSNLTQPVSLRSIVTELLSSYQRVHKERTYTTINCCPGDIFVYQSRNFLVQLLADLYKLLEHSPANSPVPVSARILKGNIQLYIARPEKKSQSPVFHLWSLF
jgi:hypothetical protein